MLKLNNAVAAILLAAPLIAAPTAHAECGDPGQDPCAGPVPTVDQVVGIMAELTDPSRPAADTTGVVAPGFAPDEAGAIDDHLNSLNGRGYLPYNFVVTDIQLAPGNSAGATVAAIKDFPYPSIPPEPIVLVNQGGRWLIVHDAAMVFLNKMWSTSRHRYVG
jgi:hypothetical protein